MHKLPWLEKYQGKTTEDFIALEGKYRIDSLVCAFDMLLQQKELKYGWDQLSEVEKTIMMVEKLEAQVNNGGFWQYFYNAPACHIYSIVDALKRIECFSTAEIAQRAFKTLGVDNPVDKLVIQDIVLEENVALHVTLNQCDESFYKYPDDIENKLFSYIKRNRDDVEIKIPCAVVRWGCAFAGGIWRWCGGRRSGLPS